MKKICLISVIALSFAACSKEEMPDPDINDPVINVVQWDYDLSYDTDGDGIENTTSSASMYNAYFPDSSWRLTLQDFPANGADPFGVQMEDMEIGFFEFGFVKNWSIGGTDTIYGSGYFDQDTMYITYTFINVANAADMGEVTIHSF